MSSLGRRCCTSTKVLALLTLIVGFNLSEHSIRADDSKAGKAADGKRAKPARPVIAVHTGGSAEDLKGLRTVLEKIPNVTFKSGDLKFSDFGRDGGLYTGFITLEMKDLNKTDVGTIGKAAAAADTSKKKTSPPLFVLIRYRPGSAKNEPFRAALAKVKGVRADTSWVGDANLWVNVDGSGQAKLAQITQALHGAGIKIKDPITDVD